MRIELLQNYYQSPEYREKLIARLDTFQVCERDPLMLTQFVVDKWAIDPIEFIEQFGWIINPKFHNEVKPFFLFDYQKKIIRKVWEAEISGQECEMLIDKPREMGLTWVMVWYYIWRWLFTKNWSGAVLSRTEAEVDDGTSSPEKAIFGKIRWGLQHLPDWLIPDSFTFKNKKGTNTDAALRLTNPAMMSAIVGSTANENAFRGSRFSCCVTGDTLIMTPRGLREIKDIIDGNETEIIDPTGITRKIKTYFKKPPLPIYRVLLRGNLEIKGTYKHPVRLLGGEFKTLSELKIGDKIELLSIPYKFGDYVRLDKELYEKSFADLNAMPSLVIPKIPEILDERLAKIMGYLISEGSLNEGGGIIFHNTDKILLEEYNSLFESVFGIKPKTRIVKKAGKMTIMGRTCKTKDSFSSQVNSVIIKIILENFGMKFVNCYNKEIPKAIFNSPKSVIESFLASLFDGDGCASIQKEKRRKFNEKIRVGYVTTSERLSNQLQVLGYSLGYKFSRTIYNEQRWKNCHELYRLDIFGQQAIKFLENIPIKKGQELRKKIFVVGKNSWKFEYQPVKSIEILKPEQTYDFEVDSEDHTYISNGIVSHNSWVDECFFVEHFQAVHRSISHIANTRVYISTAKTGRSNQKFVDLIKEAGNYISLTWQDNPFKDQVWFDEKKKEAEFDPEAMKEIEVSYSVNSTMQYYPELSSAKIGLVTYDRKRPIYVSLDYGKQDHTVLVWWQYDGVNFNILECIFKNKVDFDWFTPFMNRDLQYDKTRYLNYEPVLTKLRSWEKPRAYFGEPAHLQVHYPSNTSIQKELMKYGIRLLVNNNAIQYEVRRKAVSMILPKCVFNQDSDGVMELYDALLNSRYAGSAKGISKESLMKPAHDDEVGDFRSAFENGAVNIPNILRGQRHEVGQDKDTRGFVQNLTRFLKT